MRVCLLFLLAISLTSFKFVNKEALNYATKWIISGNSRLVVNGSTNINKFSCAINTYCKSDTVSIDQDVTSKKVFLSGKISLDVKNFDCNNIIMTKELRKTLKEDKFPFLYVNFLANKDFPTVITEKGTKGLVEIEIAGVKKRYEIDYQLKSSKDQMILRGSQAINFSDFKLDPPKKAGKLIKAKDKLTVSFELNLVMLR